ncbi:MAG: glycosyltransferase [Candidatus Pacebacteria bacterium]|nr:glycosyltransferase [Candidatus Paceibacterota bacterium]
MNILMISVDKKIFDENSAVRQRMFNYGMLVNKLYIIVLNKKSENATPGKEMKIAKNIWIFPTNSSSKFAYMLDAVKIASKLRDIDLVTSQDPYEIGLIAWRIAKKLKTKLEFQIHTDIFNPYFIKHSIANRMRSAAANFLLPKADCLRAVSKRIKKSLPEKLQEKTVVLPIFTDLARIQQTRVGLNLHKQYPRFKFIILMMSRLEKEKNISMAIAAMQKVTAIFPKTGLIIIGAGSSRKTLRRQVRRAGLEENIIFKKWTNDPLTYYKTADLFLSSSDYEGYGLSLVEAIASHCPVLTTKVGIAGEILSSNNSLLCDVGDRACFVRNLVKAQQYPALLSQFKEKAYTDLVQKTYRTEGEYLNALQKSWFDTINKKVKLN